MATGVAPPRFGVGLEAGSGRATRDSIASSHARAGEARPFSSLPLPWLVFCCVFCYFA